MATPPPLPAARRPSLALARTLNLSLPGLGLIYLGQRPLGLLLAIPFLACFGAEIILYGVVSNQYSAGPNAHHFSRPLTVGSWIPSA